MEHENNSGSPEVESEAFIPYVMDDLVEMCLSQNGLPVEKHQDFRDFTEFFAASTNFLSHQAMDSLDKDYSHFNPDSEMLTYSKGCADKGAACQRVVANFREIATNANYRQLANEEIEASFTEQSMIKLNTAVDLDEFSQIECYVRGGDTRTHYGKNWLRKETIHHIDVWRRVLLLIQFKEDSELTEVQLKRRNKARLPYEPGKIYLYQYKDVPRPDLEILFPNVRVSMNLKDRIMLGIPAVAATVGTVAKLGAKIALVVAAIAYAFFGKEIMKFNPGDATDPMKLAIVVMGILGALGGVFFKQYTSVKNKRIGFLKEVSEHLFFRNIAMNKAVFDRIIDDGEDEDCKEAVLVYYHLLANQGVGMNRKSLDNRIQDWMKEEFDTVIDFDVDGPIEKLKLIEGVTNSGQRKCLINEDENGILSIPSLDEAKEILDYHWDNAFQFSQRQDGGNAKKVA